MDWFHLAFQAIEAFFRKILPMSESFLLFSYAIFIMSKFTLKLLVHFEMISVQGERDGFSFILLNNRYPVFSAPFVEKTFSHSIF